jgi:[ribosomal protein S5]-alanine N-acetyltransferase
VTVSTARLRLPLWSAEDVALIRSGGRRPDWHPDFPREDDRDAAGVWREGDPWGPRSIVLRGSAVDGLTPQQPSRDVVVGSIGFFGPPTPAADDVPEVEVGYGLVPDARGRGVATEALEHLVGLAEQQGARVRASVAPTNRASVRVLAKCGFTELRGSTEDGELVMVRPVRRP